MNNEPPTGVATESEPQPATPGTYVFAGVGSRFIAILIDGVILSVVAGLVGGYNHGSLLSFVLNLAYGTFMIGQYGQTVGKMVMKVRVVNYDGSKPDFNTAFIRTLSTYLSAFVFMIGYIRAFFDPKRQTWHDLIAKTYVVEDTVVK